MNNTWPIRNDDHLTNGKFYLPCFSNHFKMYNLQDQDVCTSEGTEEFVRELKNNDLPTLGRPTIPILRLFDGLPKSGFSSEIGTAFFFEGPFFLEAKANVGDPWIQQRCNGPWNRANGRRVMVIFLRAFQLQKGKRCDLLMLFICFSIN